MKMFGTSFGLKTWIYSGLIWGVFMFVIIVIVPLVMEDVLITWENLYSLPIWLIGGLIMQFFQDKILKKVNKIYQNRHRLKRMLY